MLKSKGGNIVNIAIKYALQNPAIQSHLVGFSKPEQVGRMHARFMRSQAWAVASCCESCSLQIAGSGKCSNRTHASVSQGARDLGGGRRHLAACEGHHLAFWAPRE